ncbi:MAG TPA: LamG-like jellyroll fold domain-containing protein [Chthoniobacteraceae bacterium]|nr:LamG-like jellyroll fold domain-containing protein [Chthoniobacteraceae bacterium]
MSKVSSKLFLSTLLLGIVSLGLSCAFAREEPSERQRQTDRTYVFCRAQWKYGLQRNDYLNRWIDRPLFVDPALRDTATPRPIQYPGFARTQEIVKDYRLDGMGLYPETAGRAVIYDYAKEYGPESFLLLTELTAKPLEGRFDRNASIAKALESAASFRIGGRVVVIVGIADTRPIEFWEGIVKELRETFGDRIAFLPGVIRPLGIPLSEWLPRFAAGEISDQEREQIREYYRKWARLGDGLYFSTPSSIADDRRRFVPEFYRDFVIANMKSVLAEPEFAGKLFGLSAYIGHENCTRFGYTRSCDGTKTLRSSLETALAAGPELINIPEWDEQNENTSLRPTLYNGTSTLRIMRYYMNQLRGEAQSPLPGDDTAIPNLVLSYRKLLVLGEKLEIELLNIPDGKKAGSYTARITLETPDGTTVYTSPELTFERTRLHDHTLSIPSETLSSHTALMPRLEIVREGESRTFSDGLHYIGLRSTWNWDYKWVKQPLRDLMKPTQTAFTLSEPDAGGLRTVSGSIEVEEPLAYLEVLDEGKVVHMAGGGESDPWQENGEQVVLSLQWQSLKQGSRRKAVEGSIRLEGATGRWRVPNEESRYAPRLTGQRLDRLQPSVYSQRVLLAIDRQEVGNASLVIDFPGRKETPIAVADLLKHSIYGVPGPDRFNLVISRMLQPSWMPQHLKKKKSAFHAIVRPELPSSVYQMQAVGVSGRIYRSKPVVTGDPKAKQATAVVFSETTGGSLPVKVSGDALPVIDYRFTPRHGSVLVADAGRPFWAILGGYVSQATDRGGGESNDGSPFFSTRLDLPEGSLEAPRWTRDEQGRDVLCFDGQGNYIVLPQGVIPRRAGYTITMELKPETVDRRQVLFRNASHYPGSLSIYVDNGHLKADFLNEKGVSTQGADSFATLPAGEWSTVVIRYDQETLHIAVNGEEGQPIAIKGPGIYDTTSAVGGFRGDWFEGDLRRLRVDHHAPAADAL